MNFNFKSKTSFTSLIASLIFFASCSSGDFAKSGKQEEGVRTADVAPNTAENASGNNAQPVAKLIFRMKINGNTGIELCSGVVEMLIDTKFNLSPFGGLNCLQMGVLDLKEFFGSGFVEEKDEDMRQYPGFGKITRVQNPVRSTDGKPTFNPPKPNLIGPVIQDPKEYENFVFSEASSVFGLNKKTGESYQSQGQWYMKVIKTGSSYQPKEYKGSDVFDKIIEWEIKAAGFDGAPKASIKAFKRQKYWFNILPIAIPRIEIESSLKELMPDDQSFTVKAGDIFFGGVKLTLDMIDYIPVE